MHSAILPTFVVVLVLGLATFIAGPPSAGAWERDYDRVRPMTDGSGRPFEVAIEAEKPELILIGDSILESAVSADRLSELCGLNCYSFAIQGSASAMWYLMLKQGVIASGHRPKYVVVLFRDVYLTIPEYRTEQRYRGMLNYFDRDRDPLLVDLAYDPPTNPLRDFVRHHWSLFQVRSQVRERTEHRVREAAIASLLGQSEQEVLSAVDRTFADEAMAKELLTQAQESAGIPLDKLPYFDFDAQVDRSFLPAMVRLAREAGIQLVCVRLRTRRELPSVIAAEGVPEFAKELLPAYIVALRAYLTEQHVPLIDMSRESRLDIEHYAAGDHLNAELGRPLFMQILAERFRESKIE